MTVFEMLNAMEKELANRYGMKIDNGATVEEELANKYDSTNIWDRYE